METIVRIEHITPEVAKEYLSHNKGNRNLNKRTVEFYADEMKRGQWMLNGESISFAEDGSLLNGQHRLSAVILSGASIDAVVTRGLDRECFKTFDTGRKRNGGDVLSIMGTKNYTALSSIISRYLGMVRGAVAEHPRDARITTTDIYDEYRKSSEYYDEIAGMSMNFYNKIRLFAPSDIGSTMIYLEKVKKHPKEKVVSFFDDLFNIAKNSECNAINLLRTRIFNDGMQIHKMTHTYKTALLTKAWNAYITGTKVKTLRWNEGLEGKIDFI